jgi:hypothetical protein
MVSGRAGRKGIFALLVDELDAKAILRSGFKTPSKVQWLRCPAYAAGFHIICMNIKVFIRPPVNAHPPQADCAFPSGLTLDAYLNLSKIRYVIPHSGALEPDLRF